MNKFVVIADSACDIDRDTLKSWNIECIEMVYNFDGEDRTYGNFELPADEFYSRIRNGKSAKTSAVNVDTFVNVFRKYLSEGLDVLNISFSSGISGTYNFSVMAVDEVRKEFPDRKIITVDSLCGSAGFGLLLYYLKDKMAEGCDMDTLVKFIGEVSPTICHWFTVDDLKYLKRGGRISPTVAFAGTILGVKPILHMDDEGKLVNVTKARGRKSAISALAEKVGELYLPGTDGTVFISHADCFDDAKMLAEMIFDQTGRKTESISNIGPVIGAHSGPGTLSVYFIGRKR